MDSLLLANLFHRKTRSAVTILGVALGVVLVTLTVGLARGQLAERGRREAGAGAQILVRPAGAGLSNISATLSIDLSIAAKLRALPAVTDVVPLGQHFERSGQGFGWRGIDGVDFEDYARVSGLRIVEGRPFQAGDEAIVDESFARSPEGKIGQAVEFGGRSYRIVGVYAPESMSRIKVPLRSMQEYFGAEGFASILMVKVSSEEQVESVARQIRDEFGDYQVIMAKDLPAFYAKGIPALNTFLNTVVGLAIIISTLVILLTMYTTVVERTRQIGVLKSLGASRAFIGLTIEREALVISMLGVFVGYVVALTAAAIIRASTTLTIEFEPQWFIATGLLGLGSGLVGALYPALRAARMDPVEALAHE